MNIRELAQNIAKAIDDKKGVDIQILNLQGITEITDYFVIATGNNTAHIRSIADFIEEKTKIKDINPIRKQGYDEAQWIVMDYGDIIVHLFREETRKYYELEKFWRNAELVEVEF